MSKYKYISAVGQINEMACWAASLKWWYKAAMSITASQQKLWDLYKARATQDGGLPDSDMKFIISQNGMQLVEFPNAADFTFENVKALLASGPIFTAFTEWPMGKKHVNVIYATVGDSTFPEVRCMEPQDHPVGGGAYGGRHLKKNLAEFNSMGSVWAGVHRGNYAEWFDCFGGI